MGEPLRNRAGRQGDTRELTCEQEEVEQSGADEQVHPGYVHVAAASRRACAESHEEVTSGRNLRGIVCARASANKQWCKRWIQGRKNFDKPLGAQKMVSVGSNSIPESGKCTKFPSQFLHRTSIALYLGTGPCQNSAKNWLNNGRATNSSLLSHMEAPGHKVYKLTDESTDFHPDSVFHQTEVKVHFTQPF